MLEGRGVTEYRFLRIFSVVMYESTSEKEGGNVMIQCACRPRIIVVLGNILIYDSTRLGVGG